MKNRKILIIAILLTMLIIGICTATVVIGKGSFSFKAPNFSDINTVFPTNSIVIASAAAIALVWVGAHKLLSSSFSNGTLKGWKRKVALLIVADSLIILFSYFSAMFMRFDFNFQDIDTQFLHSFAHIMPFWIISTIAVYYGFNLYHSIWKLASVSELSRIVAAQIVLVPIYALGYIFMRSNGYLPRSVYVIGFIITFCLTAGMRFSYRLFKFFMDNRTSRSAVDRIMIVGAGAAGQLLIRDLMHAGNKDQKICCCIDDNSTKKGRSLEGITIVGGRDCIIEAAKSYRITSIIYAIPSASAQTKKEILNICKETGCKVMTIPAISQIVSGEVNVSKLRHVDIEDLLGREQIAVNNDEIFTSIEGKTILVTGGGGSIGSELCRQIARANPARLIIFDIYENNAYEIQQEIKRNLPNVPLTVLIGSVRNTARIYSIVKKYRPDVIFHAAAHKHVPLMEDSPDEAIKNNVIGTYKTAKAAAHYGVKKFVLISTDKAVNPTNIMGASKRLCEMVVQMMERQCKETDFVAVRFGNVLGSNGSVIPLFKKQIAEGGPVTVTDKNIIRYFMTIPEAVSLVLQAAYYAKGGEIFVLDMGEPVRIDDMARNLIRLSGYVPDVDIAIKYTGLRPGEKLFEEILMDEEGMQSTDNKMIHIGKPIEMDDEAFKVSLDRLEVASVAETDEIFDIVAEIVPTFKHKPI